jgi:hypothetical protein
MISGVLITREAAWPRAIHLCLNEVVIETRCPNIFRRFELAAAATHETIYVQDDDVDTDVPALLALYDGRLTNVLEPKLRQFYEESESGVTLIGFGCVFKREAARKFLDRRAYWEQRFPEWFLTEADRFFTFDNRPHNTVTVPFWPAKGRSGRMSGRPGHFKIRDEIMRQLRRENQQCQKPKP